MLHVGITGGIGTGKSTVCHIFEQLGIPVYYADDRAKWLMEHNPDVKTALLRIFGVDAYCPNGQLNRPYLSAQVFDNPDRLQQLNAITHPAVALDGLTWQQNQTGVPYTLKEAALLYESGSYQFLDKIIVVSAPLEVRIQRVMARDNTSRQAVLDRISRQIPQEEKESRADFVLNNDGLHFLIPQVLRIHNMLASRIP